ncbi:hypothetical protein C474_19649 [Halogeometricum pallidum JCM 14848]|uniref:Uncharacterized protein n=1 Tax=Halogeometricum pallidum JCM 14848 TaxID=1227487 RepID=M0CT54_HALPD|nr:hypothetical protein [Halogeometricum pallidum]ELZ26396.1 hypothetical protein C474_19649 [Halogeometricum pallidum JCM 14848]
MAARPPPQGGDEPDTLEFGIAALAEDLSKADVSYPVTDDELVRRLDDVAVPYNAAGGTVRLSEALESVPQSRFASKAELLDQLHPVFEEYRRSSSNNILGQLRALLPF